jgi:hypothetical protein
MSASLSHIWKPSVARLVTIDSFIPVPRGSVASAPSPLNWPAKDPGDTLDYILDIGPAIVGNDGDAILAAKVSLFPDTPGDLALQSTSADGSRIILWLSCGQAGTIYTITFSISTANGRSLQRSVLLPVLMLSAPIAPATAIITTSGSVITDQNGNPVLSGN